MDGTRLALEGAGIWHQVVSSGVSFDGGVPESEWVTLEPIGIRVLARNPEQLKERLHLIADSLDLSGVALWADLPDRWQPAPGEVRTLSGETEDLI
jgi:hypothetical protein